MLFFFLGQALLLFSNRRLGFLFFRSLKARIFKKKKKNKASFYVFFFTFLNSILLQIGLLYARLCL